MWKNDRSADFPYFGKYDTADATDPFWKPGTLFARTFRQLDLAWRARSRSPAAQAAIRPGSLIRWAPST
jgi:hypothetical protein